MNIEIAQRLYELRRKHGFSQESLAAELGLSRQAISKWERSESAPDMGNLIALADLYGMTIDELIRPEVAGEDKVAAALEPVETETIIDEGGSTDAIEMIDAADPTNTPDETSVESLLAEPSTETADTPTIEQVPAPTPLDAPPPQLASRPRCALRRFPYPLAITALFLLLALVFGLWEYLWLFLTIPFYYWVCRIVERDPNFLAAHGYSKGGQR